MKKKRTKRGARGKATPKRTRKKTARNPLHPHIPDLPPLLSEGTIEFIAADEAQHVSDGGAPNAHNHNTRTIMHAIRRALDSIPATRIVR